MFVSPCTTLERAVLTAIYPAGEAHAVNIGAVGESAAELARVAPDQLSEMIDLVIAFGSARGIVPVCLFLVPPMDHFACPLDPVVVLLRWGALTAEVASSTVMLVSAVE